MFSQVICVILLNTIANIGFGALLPIMPLLMRDYGFSASALSIPFLSIIFARIVCRFYCEKFLISQYKTVLVGLYIMYIIIYAFYIFFKNKFLFIGLRFCEGIVEGLLMIILTDIIMELSSKKNSGFYMGLFGSSFGIGMMIGPMFSGIIYSNYGINYVFILNITLGFIGIIVTMFLGHYTIKKTEKFRVSLNTLRLISHYSPSILRRVCFFSFAIFLPIYISDVVKSDVKFTSQMFALMALVPTVISPISGKLSDKISARFLILSSMVCMSILCLFLFFGFSFTKFFFLLLIFLGFMLSLGMKYFTDIIRNHESRTQIIGVAGTAMEFATLIVACIVPFIIEFNIQYVWLFLAFISLIAIIPLLKEQNS